MSYFKRTVSFALAVIFICSAFSCAYAYETAYNQKIIAMQNVTETVQDQGADDSCLAYALAATAESYCIKNNILSGRDFVFSGSKLKRKIGDSSNFGTVLYSSVKYELGNDCYITGIENLTGRGERYLKRKIKENGAVFAAIPLPDGGMDNSAYYNSRICSLNCRDDKAKVADFSGGINHAVAIVGWDDSFSADKFKGAAGNGAWICKNSYGKSWGKNGFFYLSYSYTDYFLYSACVEVSRCPDIASVKSASKPFFTLRKAGAVGFTFGSDIKDADIEIASGTLPAQTVKADITNGYNFISFPAPLPPRDISVKVNGKALSPSALRIYLIKSGNTLPAPSEPQSETEWDTALDNLKIDLFNKPEARSTLNNRPVMHSIKLDSVSNVFTVIPQDGFSFTEDTEVYIKFKVEGMLDPVEKEGKISSLGEYLNFSDGRLTVKSKNIGGGFAGGLRLKLDESSKIETVYLTEENGSERELSPDEYTLTTSPGKIPDSGSYYAEIKLNGYYASADFKTAVTRDGENIEYPPADISIEGDTVTAGVMIEIPDITLRIIETLNVFLDLFAQFLWLFNPKG